MFETVLGVRNLFILLSIVFDYRWTEFETVTQKTRNDLKKNFPTLFLHKRNSFFKICFWFLTNKRNRLNFSFSSGFVRFPTGHVWNPTSFGWMSRPEFSWHFLINNPVTSLHILFNPEYHLHLPNWMKRKRALLRSNSPGIIQSDSV